MSGCGRYQEYIISKINVISGKKHFDVKEKEEI